MKLATLPKRVIEAITIATDNRSIVERVADYWTGTRPALTGITYPGRSVVQDVELYDPLDSLTGEHKISEIRATYDDNGYTMYFRLYGVLPRKSKNGIVVCSLDNFSQEPC